MNGNSIKANRRSSSQRSIYDYPEHLNPFYEDENHKRLRFWKIGSDKSSRSNNFSIDGFKSFWTFKTFKLKKKSSSLGINKTSESPPMLLRRYDDSRYDGQSLANENLRHTVDIGLESNFQRRAPNRSSLQDLSLRNQQENFFIRNNRYRSTVQASGSGLAQSSRYQSNPTIDRSRYNQTPISKGSSQLSVNSNPFDDEYETISEVGSPERTSIRHSARKKRRAPQPPISPNKIATVEVELNSEPEKQQDSADITNLTAEIESFVRIADTDKEMLASQVKEMRTESEIVEESQLCSRQSPEHNECYSEEITIERIQNLGEIDENKSSSQCKKSPVKILIRAPTDEEPSPKIDENSKVITEIANNDEIEDTFRTISVEINEVNEVNKKFKKETHIECDEELTVKDPSKTIPTTTVIEELKAQNDADTPSNSYSAVTELKITESSDDLTQIQPESEETKQIAAEVIDEPKNSPKEEREQNGSMKYGDSSTKVSLIPLRVKNGGAKEPPTPPQRRRSVKEIIESINKCQSLLKVNQDQRDSRINDLFQSPSPSKTFKNKSLFIDRNMNDTNKKEYQTKRLFADINEVNNNAKAEEMCNIPLVVEKFNELNELNTNDLFEKCVVNNDEKESRWNPVPKPRRRGSTKQSFE